MSYPPLVAPGPDLTAEQVRRYSRHLLLPEIGTIGQRRLRAARVLVIGAGGLGSPVLLYLAAAGVGTIGIVDDDAVDESNLQRQIVHRQADLGRPKVDSAAERIRAVNPEVTVIEHQVRLDSGNALGVLAGYDVVLDGTDNFATRYLVNDACAIAGVPLVWGSIFRFDGQVSVFWPAQGPNYRDLHPVPPPPDAVPSCAEGGVLGVLCGVIGSVMATEAIKLITGTGDPLVGRVLVYDALGMTWTTLRLRPNPATEPITELIDYPAFCGLDRSTASAPGAEQITPQELAELLAARPTEQELLLVDVREPHERDIVAIGGAVPIPVGRFRTGEAAKQIMHRDGGPPARVVVHCKTGPRAAEAARLLREAGHPAVAELTGGVLAWVSQVHPELPSY